jgi:hypothetical protein
MSLVCGSYDGEKAMTPDRRTRETRPGALRDRAADMYMLKLAGRTSTYIGWKFGITKRHVNREIADLPKTLRENLLKEHRRVQKDLERLRSAG